MCGHSWALPPLPCSGSGCGYGFLVALCNRFGGLQAVQRIGTFEEETGIDLVAVRKGCFELEAGLTGLEEQMAGYPKELGHE